MTTSPSRAASRFSTSIRCAAGSDARYDHTSGPSLGCACAMTANSASAAMPNSLPESSGRIFPPLRFSDFETALLYGAMAKIVSNEYRVAKGEAKLFVFRKRLEGSSGRVLFLVHGSSLSSIPSYDLHIPGFDDYSVMDHF